MSAQDEPSGTAPPDAVPVVQQASDVAPTEPSPPPPEPEEQLDWKEVIELQTFSDRKTWIEEKTKFLEQMPPIEVFVGMDAIRASAEEVPGLPTRQELKQWLVEHDAIEKETEIFDSGELQTIKKFTKAATQRNLSREDTDLIELTLTTIYELDKLLHLLRDRSENLELLGIRLSWEEFRSAAWIDRRTIIADLKTFLDTRARWTPAVYEESVNTPPPPSASNRRASLTSLASVSSDTLLASAGFSRSARFKLAEILSRDAAQFSARITSLRHSKIAAAGKMLDKLIDTSRKPVPDDLLDEQDRLEEKGIAELENVGKFVMNAVMQWRKADEIYVESMKDQTAAQALWDEIEAAKFQHPTGRQSISFATRAEALIKRLILRGDPASPSSAFPRPTHVLFPEYKSVNDSVVQTLSSEVSTALELARRAEAAAKEYRLNYEAVHRVETLVESASTICDTFTSIVDRLQKGVPSTDGDGSPPNLMSDTCLEPTRHAVFLALLPSILKEQEVASDSAAHVLRNSRGALLGLDRPGIDPDFKTKAAAEFQRLSTLRGQAQWTKDDLTARVARLREARKLWSLMDSHLNDLEEVRRELGEAMEKHRWQQELNANGAPPTPDSFSTPLPTESPHAESIKRLDGLDARLNQEVDVPLAALSRTLEAPLKDRLLRSSAGLKKFLEQVRQMAGLLQSIKNQAAAMGTVRDDFNDLQMRIDDLKLRVDTGVEDVLAGKLVTPQLSEVDSAVTNGINDLRTEVKAFTDSLSQRVPFVSTGSARSPTSTKFVKRRFSSIDLTLAAFNDQPAVELPFDLQSLDDAVRADSNTYAMKLGGKLQALEQRATHFQLAQMAKDVDVSLSAVVADINAVVQQFSTFKNCLNGMAGQPDVTGPLAELARDAQHLSQSRRTPIARSFSPIRELLRKMEATPGSHDPAVHQSLYLARVRAVDDAELRFKTWTDDADTLIKQVSEAQRAEAARLEAERIAEEQRLQAERERIAAEEAERARLERERLEEEKRLRLEQERLAEERRLQAEKERIAAEEAAQALIAKQKAEEEERVRLELARLEEERRLQAERERIAAEEAERARLERERLEMEEKLRLAEEQLAEERRLQAERARLAAEQAERERVEKERFEKEERERVEEERRQQAEKERLAFEEVERARIAAEKAEQQRVEAERLAREERARIEEAQRLEAEQARLAAEAAEKLEQERVEKERQAIEARLKMVEEQLAEERRLAAEKAEQERLERDRQLQAEKERLAAEEAEKARPKIELSSPVHDVFGLRVGPSLTPEMSELQNRIFSLRKRLRTLSIEGLAISSVLPPEDELDRAIREFFSLCEEVSALPPSAEDPSINAELNSLRTEIERATQLIEHLESLQKFCQVLHSCDAALSDLLEHIDTYPSAPLSVTSSFQAPKDLLPEEQLSSRLAFTTSEIDRMMKLFVAVKDDERAIAERDRIQQTWSELEEMAKDRIIGKRSRPVSVSSSASRGSGRNSRASLNSRASIESRPSSIRKSPTKAPSYSVLSASPATTGPSQRARSRLIPPQPQNGSRRSTYGTDRSRPASQLSHFSSNRSTSGPVVPGSTFASRQRTTSMVPPANVPPRRASATAQFHRERTASPTVSEASSYSRSFMSPSSRSSSVSTTNWSRTPRYSLAPPPKTTPPRKTAPPPRKKYVANPKNKLDVAVGEVVNKLPVGISIEGVSDSWKDQSGKYWIGDMDPKLCFCRILRSQTVMVRVGGGWTELSKFIRDHFADSFRMLENSPPGPGAAAAGSEPKWISSTTLLEAAESEETTPPRPPRTPEPRTSTVPSFSLVTPTGGSPHSLKSSPSINGSPLNQSLTPLQFIRRAEPHEAPSSPSKTASHVSHPHPHPHQRTRTTSSINTPARNSIWRP
ncbi:growth arrest-specific 2-like protein [Favolaschia claudopus]|uniref:Growth arrest-specific 2-like protein n=1 Tax=Favolaschia claudopus TaxID=2862362 RepID=A0AAW0EB43_9AGAR